LGTSNQAYLDPASIEQQVLDTSAKKTTVIWEFVLIAAARLMQSNELLTKISKSANLQ
jgi:hypothetical protein